MSIKRYRFYIDPDTHCFCEMEELADGSYVAHEDYAELEAQLAALQVKLTNTEWHLANEANLHAEAAAQLEAITTKHVELGDKLPNIHAHDRWLIMENVIKSEAILEDKT